MGAEALDNLGIGFTGHAARLDTDLVDMGGRSYYPRLGRFFSPDPLVVSPLDAQVLDKVEDAGDAALSDRMFQPERMRYHSRTMAKRSRPVERRVWLVMLGMAACTHPDGPVLATDAMGSSTEGHGSEPPGTSSTDAVDGTDTASSPTGTGAEPVCGNGIVEDGEACDDAGPSSVCNGDCTASTCGDGTLNAAAGEVCDDAGESTSCDDDCTLAECGDDHLNATAGEQCDGREIGGETCESQGYTAGMLACTAACALDVVGCANPPLEPSLALDYSPVKQFDLSWPDASGAVLYRLEESVAPGEPFAQVGSDIVGNSLSLTVPLCFRHAASYRLLGCNDDGCTSSAPVDVAGSLSGAVGYFKASNTGSGDMFGWAVALSGDGSTLAVAAIDEDSSATGVGGNQASNSTPFSGAVYVFVRDPAGGWSQQAYIKASNTGQNDAFGYSLAISEDGSTLAVGANLEDSDATGIDGDQANNLAVDAGAAYVFARDGAGSWSQQAYIKASNTVAYGGFGQSLDLSADGSTLVVGGGDASSATGINGNQADVSAPGSGAAYVFVRDGAGSWSQQAYVKASNTDAGDSFGWSVTLAADGNTLAVGAYGEQSSATGIGGNQSNDSLSYAGAAYVYVRNGAGQWSQQAYVKPSNTGFADFFGWSVALSGDGDTLAVGAYNEDSIATGIGGNQANNDSTNSGAAYVFVRNGAGSWSQQAYVKASNTNTEDAFGRRVALDADGSTLAVTARHEDSNAIGLEGSQGNNTDTDSGATYLFVREAGAWSQQAYVKSSNTDPDDAFGYGLALSADAATLAVGAMYESSNATGIDGDQANNAALQAGAVYLY